MRTLTHTIGSRHNYLAFLHDSRFWAVAALIAFVIFFTLLLVWAAQHPGPAPTMPETYQYWPYGPYPIPMR